MNKIQTLYKYLMLNLQASSCYWYNDYKRITKAIEEVRDKLKLDPTLTLAENTVYAENSYFKDWEDFLSKLFANKANGIASIGRSIFSAEMTNEALNNNDFIMELTNVVKDPSLDNYVKFVSLWYSFFRGNNPVQVNRAMAACKTSLSSTVDEVKFNVVFDWFVNNKYVEVYTDNGNWYEKNVYLVNEIRKSLKNGTTYIDLKSNDNLELDDYWVNIFIWLAYENIANPFNLNKQLVKYGAPGTGKTFLSKQVCKLQFEIWKNRFDEDSNFDIYNHLEIIQFHPTYSYEDFVEGLRPVNVNGNIQLQLKNGVFKQFCKDAGKWEKDLYVIDPEKDFTSWTVEDIQKSEEEHFSSEHWSYIKSLEANLLIEEVLPPFFLIIDEINRAELSAVFGELMYSLEYRGAKHAIKTQYSELNSKETALLTKEDNHKFFVPHNLYIIGTMNTIDRSVDSFDFALRRRFRWEKVSPDMDLLYVHLNTVNKEWSGLVDSVDALNTLIGEEELLGEDYQLGHAYFWDLKYSKDLTLKKVKEQIWDDRLGALIEEYLRGSGRQDVIEDCKKTFVG